MQLSGGLGPNVVRLTDAGSQTLSPPDHLLLRNLQDDLVYSRLQRPLL